jgi:hypothetical protein
VARLVVQTGHIADVRSETWLTLFDIAVRSTSHV